jgi:Ca-activated chloride channel family protein
MSPAARLITAISAFLLIISLTPVHAQMSGLVGRVVMEDGSAPPKTVRIERICSEDCRTTEGMTNRRGEYALRLSGMEPSYGWITFRCGGLSQEACHLRGHLPGYESTLVEMADPDKLPGGRLPDIVLSRKAKGPTEEVYGLPRHGVKEWKAGVLAFGNGRFDEAQRLMRIVVRLDSKYTPAWNALGRACQKLNNYDEARRAFARSLELRPERLSTQLLALRLESETKQWETTARLATALIERDSTHRYAEAYLHLAVAQAATGNLEAADRNAAEAMRLDSRHELLNVASIRARIAEARRNPATRTAEASLPAVELNLNAIGHAGLPGGARALGRLAGFNPPERLDDFFEAYTRGLIERSASHGGDSVTGFPETVRGYFAALAELPTLGEPRGSGTLITLNPADRARTERVLSLLGLRMASSRVRFSEERTELVRHPVARVLGLDAVALIDALEAGRPFQFEIPAAEAPLLGGDAWLGLTAGGGEMPGGVAEAFARDSRLAKSYAGLSAAGSSAATALVTACGLPELVSHYADTLFRHGATLRMRDGTVALPGGQAAARAWTELAGNPPSEPGPFFRSLLEKDRGRLISFYAALARLEESRARLLTATPARLKALYAAYSDSDSELFAHCALDAGQLDEFIGAGAELRRALVAIGGLRDKRGAELDAESIALLRSHFAEWRPLWPYFERFKRLEATDFQALAAFEAVAHQAPPARREALLGVWYALIDLAPDDSTFRVVSRELAEGRLPAELFRTAMPDQRVPATIEAAAKLLVEKVYAERLDARMLLRIEQPGLAGRHRFASAGHAFEETRFEPSNRDNGSRFTGGLMRLAEVARPLARVPASATWSETNTATTGQASFAKAAPQDLVFRAEAGLVEVYATVRDARGRYVDSLTAADFAVLENGEKLNVRAFESAQAEITCALVLDTTMSMHMALPVLQNSALGLIEQLRRTDAAGVYTFSNVLVGTGEYTRDKTAARRAVVEAEARGETALHDALVGVLHELAPRPGKKAVVVFTDGNDNVSTLSMETAAKRARLAGIPLFVIAQGAALNSKPMLARLDAMADQSGGQCFRVRLTREIEAVFDRIAKELSHGYLLSVNPRSGEPGAWHAITVEAGQTKSLQVRARQGYFGF